MGRCHGPKRNSEGYLDPTAYEVMKEADETERFNKFLKILFYICELSGYRFEGRFTVVDKKTGRVWK